MGSSVEPTEEELARLYSEPEQTPPLGERLELPSRSRPRWFLAGLAADVCEVERDSLVWEIRPLESALLEEEPQPVVREQGDVIVDGPVGVTLFSGGPTSDDGVLARGTITAPDDGNGCGWETMDEVIAAIRAGETYVNVHTVAHPPGEIRGQVH